MVSDVTNTNANRTNPYASAPRDSDKNALWGRVTEG